MTKKALILLADGAEEMEFTIAGKSHDTIHQQLPETFRLYGSGRASTCSSGSRCCGRGAQRTYRGSLQPRSQDCP